MFLVLLYPSVDLVVDGASISSVRIWRTDSPVVSTGMADVLAIATQRCERRSIIGGTGASSALRDVNSVREGSKADGYDVPTLGSSGASNKDAELDRLPALTWVVELLVSIAFVCRKTGQLSSWSRCGISFPVDCTSSFRRSVAAAAFASGGSFDAADGVTTTPRAVPLPREQC